MTGFKNAPTITAFKRGMVVQGSNTDKYTVIGISRHVHMVDQNGEYNWCQQHECDHFTLDLDSIWEGRKYIFNEDATWIATIEAVADNCVGYYWSPIGKRCCDIKKWFLRNYHPEPLPVPIQPKSELKVGDVVEATCYDDRIVGIVYKIYDSYVDIKMSSTGSTINSINRAVYKITKLVQERKE